MQKISRELATQRAPDVAGACRATTWAKQSICLPRFSRRVSPNMEVCASSHNLHKFGFQRHFFIRPGLTKQPFI